MHIRVWRQGRGYCLQVNGLRHCGLGFTVGSGWTLLLYTAKGPVWLRNVMDAVWLALLVFPVGFWAPRGLRFVMLGAGVLLAIGYLPPLIGLVGTSTTELLAALLGLAAGNLAHRMLNAPGHMWH